MNEALKSRCDLLVQNRKTITDAYKWDVGLLNLSAACLYTSMGQQVDTEALKKCESILKSATGIFSEFRGNVKIPLLCKMALSEDPDAYFARIQSIYQILNQQKWWGSEYKIMAAMIICDHAEAGDEEKYIERTNQLYSRMKEKHKWLTSDEDTPFAAMLAITDKSIDSMVEEMEKIYTLLKKNFSDNDAVQSLSHVLTLDDKPAEEKCEKVKKIFDLLKAAKHKYNTGYGLPSLGVLNLLDLPESEIAELIIEADDYLKGHKGFGSFSLGDSERRIFAAQMVISVCKPDERHGNAIVLDSMLAYSISMEMALLAILCTTTLISSSSSSQ